MKLFDTLKKLSGEAVDKVKNASIPDSTFDPIRSLTMRDSSLKEYQRNRDRGIAEKRAQKSPSAIIKPYGSYSPYTETPSKVKSPTIAKPKPTVLIK